MTIQELYAFMVEKKILKAKTGEIELELHPDALLPTMTPGEQAEYDKKIREIEEEEKNIDYRFLSA